MRFVPDWRRAWRWFSVQCLAVLALLPIVWTSLPAEAHEWVPVGWRPWIVVGLAVAGIIGRLVDQNPKAAA